ncbi:MAG: hypothetical protein E4H26_06245 [Flavobacteriales bacterium]|nr:MAG: hypothetical protein E4H26_06245 [Flavobacteriales bacterium]
MKNILPFIFTVMLLLVGCTDRDDDLEAINIRVKNNNDFAYETVQVGDSEKPLTDIAAGKYSEYIPFETAYRYAYVQIVASGETYVLQPIDFVGETPLNAGFYTYELKIGEDGLIALEFKQEL